MSAATAACRPSARACDHSGAHGPGSRGIRDDALIRCAKVLDKHYIPTRYPNGFESGALTNFYTREEAEGAIECADAIIAFCRDQIG